MHPAAGVTQAEAGSSCSTLPWRMKQQQNRTYLGPQGPFLVAEPWGRGALRSHEDRPQLEELEGIHDHHPLFLASDCSALVTASAPGTGPCSSVAEGWPGLADDAPLGQLFILTCETGAVGRERVMKRA